jgi:hypothetical protein
LKEVRRIFATSDLQYCQADEAPSHASLTLLLLTHITNDFEQTNKQTTHDCSHAPTTEGLSIFHLSTLQTQNSMVANVTRRNIEKLKDITILAPSLLINCKRYCLQVNVTS